MATQLLFAPLMAFKNGVFSPGATVEFYLSTTTTPVVVTDADGLTIAQPVEADAAGVFPEIYRAGGAALKAVIKDSDGATIATIDPIAQVNSLGSAADNISFTPVTGNTATDVQTAIENNTANSVKSNVDEDITANWTFSGNPKVTGSWLLLQRSANPRIDFEATAQPSGSNQRRSGFYIENNGHLIYALRNDDGSFDSQVFRFDRDGGVAAGISVLNRNAGDARYVQQANQGLMTPQATTSGTAFDFTSIPSGATQITVCFDEVSLSGSDSFLIQLGDSGGIETTGYQSTSGASASATSSTSGLVILGGGAARLFSGSMILTLMNSSTNTWVQQHGLSINGLTNYVTGGGRKSLSAALDRLRITRTGSDTFDAGSVNVSYR